MVNQVSRFFTADRRPAHPPWEQWTVRCHRSRRSALPRRHPHPAAL